jgi:hypothetical protein
MKSMKVPSLAVCLVLGCVFLTTVQEVSTASRKAIPGKASARSQTAPRITNAKMKGSKVIILGENFDSSTVVLINGQAVKTVIDSESPTSILVAKKIHKATPMGAEVQLAVKTASGQTSEPFAFFVGKTILFDDSGKTITLSVGEKVMLLLKRDNYEWTPSVQDPAILLKVEDPTLVPGAQGIYQAQRTGKTVLDAIGELPCSKLKPPCLAAPAVQFTADIVVQ